MITLYPVLAALALAACGAAAPRPFVFGSSSVTPAAMGEVATSVGPNGNTQLTIDVKHLAPPDRVKPGATVYVAWATEIETGASPHSLGALKVDENLNGKLKSLTTLSPFDVMITAEPTAVVDMPGSDPVLRVRVTPRS